jgi:predicted transcriptional regulator
VKEQYLEIDIDETDKVAYKSYKHFYSELSKNEIKILLTLKSEKGSNPRTPRGIHNDTGLSLGIVNATLSDLKTKELVAKNENRWDLTDKGRQLLESITS